MLENIEVLDIIVFCCGFLIAIVFMFLCFNVYFAIKRGKEYYYGIEMLKKEQEILAIKPLTWDRETGFNRAPTLKEAQRFAVSGDGDDVRRQMTEGKPLSPLDEIDQEDNWLFDYETTEFAKTGEHNE